MAGGDSIQVLVSRVRQGDEEAARILVQTYETEIRAEIRARFRDRRLRRILETMDIFQSVFATFFTRVALGQYDAEHPAELLRLLVRITRSKVIDQHRRQSAARRDYRRVESLNDDESAAESPDTDPERQLAVADLVQRIRDRMSENERKVVDLRLAGRSWDEVAQTLDENVDAVRKRFDRAITRASNAANVKDLE